MEVIEKFLFHCEFEKRLDTKTLKAYSTDLKQFKIFLKSHNVASILKTEKEDIKKYLQSLSIFKPKTIKRKIASVKAMYNFLEFEELITLNPFRKVRIQIKEPLILPRVMNFNEASMMLKRVYYEAHTTRHRDTHYIHLEKLRDVAVLELLFGTGIRVSELCTLKHFDLGMDYSSIRVKGKGNKERTIQIMNLEIKQALKRYFQNFEESILKKDFFFINRMGNRLSEQSVRLMIKKYRKLCNISKNITPHVFRHTFATLLLEQDVDIKYIQNILGHSSIMTTQIYTHVSSEKQADILQNKHPRNALKLFSW